MLPFSLAMITDYIEPRSEGLPFGYRPFQLCPPGGHLAGITFIVADGKLRGVKNLFCEFYHPDAPLSVTVDLMAQNAQRELDIYTRIGSPDASGDEAFSHASRA